MRFFDCYFDGSEPFTSFWIKSIFNFIRGKKCKTASRLIFLTE